MNNNHGISYFTFKEYEEILSCSYIIENYIIENPEEKRRHVRKII